MSTTTRRAPTSMHCWCAEYHVAFDRFMMRHVPASSQLMWSGSSHGDVALMAVEKPEEVARIRRIGGCP